VECAANVVFVANHPERSSCLPHDGLPCIGAEDAPSWGFFGDGEVVELVKRVFWTLLCIPVSGMGAIEL
jgi:hypothetical protein